MLVSLRATPYLDLQRGIGLIEVLTSLALMSLVLALSVPSIGQWIQDSRIKAHAQSLQAAVLLARTEALKRNAAVTFHLVEGVSGTCIVSPSGTGWSVLATSSSGSAQAKYDMCAAPESTLSQSTHPNGFDLVAQSSPLNDGRVVVSSKAPDGVYAEWGFNGIGRGVGFSGDILIDVKGSDPANCKENGGADRCMRIIVSSSGPVRLCDPALTNKMHHGICPK